MPSKPIRKPPVRVAVVTDSSACLPAALLQDLSVTVVPLAFQFDGQQFRDGELPPAEFYRRLEAGRHAPSTAAPGPGDFLEAFRRAHFPDPQENIALLNEGKSPAHRRLIFDEFFNYHGYQLHEFKAFHEFLARTKLKPDYLAYSGQQMSVRLVSPKGKSGG